MADEKNPLANLGKPAAATETKPAPTLEQEQAERNTRAPLPLREQGGRRSLMNHPPKAVQGSSKSIIDSGDEPAVRYSSHPIANFRLGRFRFDRGLLNLDSQDASEFEDLLEQLPVTERRRITKLDVRAAERFLEERAANRRAGATQQFDSSIGERAGATPVGTEDLGHASRSQMDANQVVDVNTNAPPPAEETIGKKPLHEA